MVKLMDKEKLLQQFQDDYLINDVIYRICEHLVWVKSKDEKRLMYFSDRLAVSVALFNRLDELIESIG